MSPLTGKAGLTQINRWESSPAPSAPASALITGAIHTEVKKKMRGGGEEGREEKGEGERGRGREGSIEGRIRHIQFVLEDAFNHTIN